MRRSLVVALLVAGLLASAAVALAAKWPTRYDLPDGSRPEGIAAGENRQFYVGSIPTGAVYRFDAKTGDRTVAVQPAENRAAIGLKYDRKRDRLFVAGGPTGKAFVYDADSGDLIEEFQLTAPPATFVNDVVLTRKGAYFTDSQQPTVYFVDRKLSGSTPIALQGFDFKAGQFNLNGIVASPNGKWLIAVQSATGALWRIDAGTGAARQVDLGGTTLTGGDGLLLRSAKKLYVVQNRINQVSVVRLNGRYTAGRVVRTFTDPGFDVPTTVAKIGSSLFFVNARFSTEPKPDTDYWVTRVRR